MAQPPQRVVYFADMTDDFAGTKINARKVDASFPYIHRGILWKAAAFLLYYGIAVPLTALYIKAINGTKFVNRKALKKIKGSFFLYGNHTHWSDAFLAYTAAAPKRTYLLASPDAVSIKGIQTIVLMLGAIPIPTQPRALRRFHDVVTQRCAEGACIAIYPEAHIWPYYMGIRPFSAASFIYPTELNVPVVAMATVYRKRRWRNTPAHTVIFSDPIQPAPGMTRREAQRYLHQRVYDFLAEKANSPDNYAYIRYEQK